MPVSTRPLAVRVIPSASAFKVAAVALVVCYVAAEIVVPLVVAILLALLLQPVVGFLDRHRVPHTLSVLTALLLTTGLILGLIGFGYMQLSGATEQFGRWFARLQEAYAYLVSLASWTPGPAASDPVAYLKPEFWTGLAVRMLSQLTVFAASMAVIIFFVFFLLRDSRVLTRRIVAASGQKWGITQELLGKINFRIHQYMATIFVIEACLASALALILWALDVPYAFLWALLAGVLGTVPFIGATIAAIPPVLVTLAEFDGYGRALAVLSLYVALQVVDGKFITPMLVGRRVNLSPLVILLSTLFWGWIWGAMGLILATPILVCVKVVAENIPSLQPLSTLLGGSDVADAPIAPAPTEVPTPAVSRRASSVSHRMRPAEPPPKDQEKGRPANA